MGQDLIPIHLFFSIILTTFIIVIFYFEMDQYMEKAFFSDILHRFYYLLYFYCFIKLDLMAKRPLTKGQKQTRNIFIAFLLIFVLVGLGANLIVSREFGIFLQIGSPSHDSPMSCAQDESLECTTKEGKCTKDQNKCVYPESSEECSIVMFYEKLPKNTLKTLKSLYQNEWQLMEKKKKLEQYCSHEMVNLYTAMENDLNMWTIIFEVVLSLALFGLFFEEIARISHSLAYD